ncbi:MAG: hypothetical protein JRN52_08330 [Nitrososphaerota archaeon]|nr:hypothetical protein [Nitrososphaerota archaeon]
MPKPGKKEIAEKSLKPPTFIEVENLNELARLVCALERAPLPTFAMNVDSRHIISTQLDMFLGSPIFYFAEAREVKQYLGYRTTANGEETTLVDIPSNPSLAYAPVIDVVKIPHIFVKGLEAREYSGTRFLSLQVKDLMSLVKVATYKIMFEEPPLPIFAFPSNSGKWRIGTFTRIEDLEEASIFFFFEQDARPQENFVAYSTSKAQASFTNRTDEHGSLFVKVVRLKKPHPLVEP